MLAAGSLAGMLAGWLTGCLVGWLAGWFAAAWLAGWLVGWLAYWLLAASKEEGGGDANKFPHARRSGEVGRFLFAHRACLGH